MTSPATTPHRGEFQNEPFVDFSKPENRAAMEAALRQVKGMFGREYPLVIGGQKITTTEKIKSTNPSHPEDVVGIFQKATVEMANQAVEAAAKAFEHWKRVPAEERVACASAASNSTPGCATKSARPGPKPKRTSPSSSISANTTAAKCCASPPPRN
jgi:hypothetical protein